MKPSICASNLFSMALSSMQLSSLFFSSLILSNILSHICKSSFSQNISNYNSSSFFRFYLCRQSCSSIISLQHRNTSLEWLIIRNRSFSANYSLRQSMRVLHLAQRDYSLFLIFCSFYCLSEYLFSLVVAKQFLSLFHEKLKMGLLFFYICFLASNSLPAERNSLNSLHCSGSKRESFMMMFMNLSMVLSLLLTNSSSLLITTFDFINAKMPFSGKAGKMYPPSFRHRICLRSTSYVVDEFEFREPAFDGAVVESSLLHVELVVLVLHNAQIDFYFGGFDRDLVDDGAFLWQGVMAAAVAVGKFVVAVDDFELVVLVWVHGIIILQAQYYSQAIDYSSMQIDGYAMDDCWLIDICLKHNDNRACDQRQQANSLIFPPIPPLQSLIPAINPLNFLLFCSIPGILNAPLKPKQQKQHSKINCAKSPTSIPQPRHTTSYFTGFTALTNDVSEHIQKLQALGASTYQQTTVPLGTFFRTKSLAIISLLQNSICGCFITFTQAIFGAQLCILILVEILAARPKKTSLTALFYYNETLRPKNWQQRIIVCGGTLYLTTKAFAQSINSIYNSVLSSYHVLRLFLQLEQTIFCCLPVEPTKAQLIPCSLLVTVRPAHMNSEEVIALGYLFTSQGTAPIFVMIWIMISLTIMYGLRHFQAASFFLQTTCEGHLALPCSNSFKGKQCFSSSYFKNSTTICSLPFVLKYFKFYSRPYYHSFPPEPLISTNEGLLVMFNPQVTLSARMQLIKISAYVFSVPVLPTEQATAQILSYEECRIEFWKSNTPSSGLISEFLMRMVGAVSWDAPRLMADFLMISSAASS